MASIDFEKIVTPVTQDNPCGEDLEMERDYANFMASLSNRLPKSYFTPDSHTGVMERFDASDLDLDDDLAKIETFLAKTKDLRLLSQLCRIALLGGDLQLFSDAVRGMAHLLETHWDSVYPRADEGDFFERNNTVRVLDERGVTILPLSFVPLAEAPRFGTVTYRHMVIAKAPNARLGSEEEVTVGTLTGAIASVDGARLAKTFQRLKELKSAATAINRVLNDKIGIGSARTLTEFPKALDDMCAFISANAPAGSLDAVSAEAEPTEEDEPEEGAAHDDVGAAAATTVEAGGAAVDVEIGTIANSADARAAMEALAAFFNRHEPSSPALILLHHALTLHGKSFADVIDLLAPGRKADAAFNLGGSGINLPLDVPHAPEGGASEGENPEPASFSVADRRQADRLLRLVCSYYETNEPSSPVPLILRRATELMSRNFLALLQDVFPPPPASAGATQAAQPNGGDGEAGGEPPRRERRPRPQRGESQSQDEQEQ